MNLNIGVFLPAEERKRALLSAFLLFAITAAFIILKSARDAFFLSVYSSRALPFFMGLGTLATAVVAAIYLRLYQAFALNQAVDLSWKAFSVGTLILWAGVKAEWPAATAILYIWVAIFGAIAPVQAWSVISQQLLTRQARRAFGIVGAGGIAGASAGGFFANWIAGYSSVSALLPTGAVFILLALFCCQALIVLGGMVPPVSGEKQQGTVRPRFITLVLVVVGAGTVVSTFADFQFKVIAQREQPSAELLATFFGSFYAYINIATLLFQIFITPFMMNRMGIAAALSFLPLGLAAGNGLLIGSSSLAAAVFLKGNEQLFRHSLHRSSLEVLYMAIPDHSKIRLKSLIDSVGVRASEGIAALLLVVLFSVGRVPLSFVAALAMVLAGAAIVASMLLSREYARALKGAIRKEEVSLASAKAEFFTTDFYSLVPDLLQSAKKETVLDLLQALDSSSTSKLKMYLVPMLKHDDPDVRLKALQLLFGQQEDFSREVEPLVADPERKVRVEAIHYLCFRASIDPLEKLAHLMTDPDPTVQAAACACSLNQEMAPAQELAYQRLENLLDEAETPSQFEVRLEVAQILEYVKPSTSSAELARRLLADLSSEVRKSTLRSIAKTSPPALLPDLMNRVEDHALRQELRSALASYGETALPELEHVLENPASSIDAKKLVLRVASDIGTPKAVEILFTSALGPNLVLRFIAIKALNRLRKNDSLLFSRHMAVSLLEQELRALQVEMERAEFIAPRTGSLMDSLLNQRQFWALQRIFRVLGLLYDPKAIYNAYLAVTSNDHRRADAALEFLDATLSPEHRKPLLHLLETQQMQHRVYDRYARKSMLFSYLGARDDLPASAMIADLTIEEFDLWKDEITQGLKTFPNLPMVEETFQWRCAKMQPVDNLKRKLTTIEKLESLNRIDIFSRLGPQELLLIANQCDVVEFSAGETIYSEGQTAQEIYALIRGKVELFRGSTSIAKISQGESFGTLSVLSRQTRLLSARAVENSVCLKIDAENFWDVLEDYPAIIQQVLKLLTQRLRILAEPAQPVKL